MRSKAINLRGRRITHSTARSMSGMESSRMLKRSDMGTSYSLCVTVVLFVAGLAKPTNIERLAVVIVVGDRIGVVT